MGWDGCEGGKADLRNAGVVLTGFFERPRLAILDSLEFLGQEKTMMISPLFMFEGFNSFFKKQICIDRSQRDQIWRNFTNLANVYKSLVNF